MSTAIESVLYNDSLECEEYSDYENSDSEEYHYDSDISMSEILYGVSKPQYQTCQKLSYFPFYETERAVSDVFGDVSSNVLGHYYECLRMDWQQEHKQLMREAFRRINIRRICHTLTAKDIKESSDELDAMLNDLEL